MNAAPTTHGLNHEWVRPDWTPLCFDEVHRILQDFPDCGEAMKILTVSPRPFSAASVIATSAGSVFVKRQHRSVRNREGLQEEHSFLKHLRAAGFPVPRLFANHAGETAIEFGEWVYEVHEVPAGLDLYADVFSWTPFFSTEHAFSAGAMLARLHNASHGFDAPARPPRPLICSFSVFASKDPDYAMQCYLQNHPALDALPMAHHCADEALQLLRPFHEQLIPHLPALEPLWTHNDLHGSNLLWKAPSANAQATALIDFGLADRTNAVHDLAQAIERSIAEWLLLDENSEDTDNIPIHIDHLHALLDGYTSIRSLTRAEALALMPMAALCHAEFALTEADYFVGVLHQHENTRVCLEDYLVGRARWMHGPGGDRLLNAINDWTKNYLRMIA